jgi:4-hydroxybenzoate polyprenyltransferase
LIQSTIIQLQFTNHLVAYSSLVFFATIFIYNFQRFFYKPQQDYSLNSIRRKWIFENQNVVKLLTFIGFIGVVITFFFNDEHIVFYLSPLLILSFAYFFSFIKLRESPLFKLFTLVIVWTMVTAVIPVLLSDAEPFTKNNLLHVFTRFCFMLAICIPFDIRDLQIDNADNVSTLPQIIGEKNARWLAFGFMLIYMILIIAEYILGIITMKVFIALMISALINSTLVLMSSSKRSEYFYVALLDGTMILQGAMLIGAELFL